MEQNTIYMDHGTSTIIKLSAMPRVLCVLLELNKNGGSERDCRHGRIQRHASALFHHGRRNWSSTGTNDTLHGPLTHLPIPTDGDQTMPSVRGMATPIPGEIRWSTDFPSYGSRRWYRTPVVTMRSWWTRNPVPRISPGWGLNAWKTQEILGFTTTLTFSEALKIAGIASRVVAGRKRFVPSRLITQLSDMARFHFGDASASLQPRASKRATASGIARANAHGIALDGSLTQSIMFLIFTISSAGILTLSAG